MNCIESFGFWNFDQEIQAGKYKICPVDNFAQAKADFSSCLNIDKFFYPPIVNQYKILNDAHSLHCTPNDLELIPNTSRPATLYQTPISHQILSTDSSTADFRHCDGALILRLLGVLGDTQLQFEDWRQSGRFRCDYDSNPCLQKKDLEHLFEQAFATWNQWDAQSKKTFLNLCFMYSRSFVYEWDFEQFQALYSVLDAIWFIQNLNDKEKYPDNFGHSRRMNRLLKNLEMHENAEITQAIADVRNNLIHQSTWGCGQESLLGGSSENFKHKEDLRRIVKRMILAVVGVKATWIKSNWQSICGNILWDERVKK